MKAIIPLFISILLVGSVLGASGSIWTTNGDCGDDSQDVNHFGVGDTVYINGDGFDEEEYPWDITGLPGGASGDPDMVVASGNQLVDESGSFCIAAYVVQEDDWGEYKAHFGNKQDNYRVEKKIELEEVPRVPEFSLLAGAGVLSAAGVFIYLRRR